jgi:hypothetical protein
MSAPNYHLAEWARKNLNIAVRAGWLTRPSKCETCGGPGNITGDRPRIYAHHEDYARPWDVQWLCNRCHAQRHTEIRELERGAVKTAFLREPVRRRVMHCSQCGSSGHNARLCTVPA